MEQELKADSPTNIPCPDTVESLLDVIHSEKNVSIDIKEILKMMCNEISNLKKK